LDKLDKFAKERTVEKLTISTDTYTNEKNLIVIHGMKTKDIAVAVAQILKDYKDYKIADASIVISNENYKIVQIYKNLDEYITGKGPNWNAKQKPEIVLPVEEVVKPAEEAKQQNNAPGKGEQQNQDTKGELPVNSNETPGFGAPPAPGTPPVKGKRE
jgi:hypothetical protein